MTLDIFWWLLDTGSAHDSWASKSDEVDGLLSPDVLELGPNKSGFLSESKLLSLARDHNFFFTSGAIDKLSEGGGIFESERADDNLSHERDYNPGESDFWGGFGV